MAGEWTESALGDVADVNWGDVGVTKASYVPVGYAAYSASGPDGFRAKYDFDRTGVVISAIGANCGQTWLARGKWSCIKNTLRFWSNTSEVDSDYLYWATKRPEFWPRRGSAQPFISQGDARAVRVSLPPFGEQKAIAELLGALDDKIELNRRMAETLEAMARALFKSWFVDFDPVRAKAEGRPTGLPEPLTALFPARLTADGLPEGWQRASLLDFFDLEGGGRPKTSIPEYWGGDVPWFSVVDAPASGPYVLATERTLTAAGLASCAATLLPENATIITARGTVGKLALVGRAMATNQSCYAAVARAGWGPLFIFFLMRSQVEKLQAQTHGSVFDTITKATFAGATAIKPSLKLAVRFELAATPLMARTKAATEQSRTLAALRDTLLPKLISGELRIRDAERAVAAA